MTSSDEIVSLKRSQDGRIATLTFVGPGRVNEINEDVIAALHRSVDELKRGDLPRVLVLRGTDKMFSGGADLRMFLEMDEDSYVRFVTSEFEFCRKIEALPCLTVA